MKNDNKTFYLCNPLLNYDCRKNECFMNDGECYATSHPEYAAKDEQGKPIEVKLFEVGECIDKQNILIDELQAKLNAYKKEF